MLHRSRPGTASWKRDDYERMQDALAEEFELAERYDELQAKMAHVNDLIKCGVVWRRRAVIVVHCTCLVTLCAAVYRYCIHVKKEDLFERLELKIVYILTLEVFLSLLGVMTGTHVI